MLRMSTPATSVRAVPQAGIPEVFVQYHRVCEPNAHSTEQDNGVIKGFICGSPAAPCTDTEKAHIRVWRFPTTHGCNQKTAA